MAHLAVLSATRSAARFGFSEGWTRGTTTRSSCSHCPCSDLVAIALACSAASSPACPAVNYTVNCAASENRHKQSKYIRLRCVFSLSYKTYKELRTPFSGNHYYNTGTGKSPHVLDLHACIFSNPPPPQQTNKNLQ